LIWPENLTRGKLVVYKNKIALIVLKESKLKVEVTVTVWNHLDMKHARKVLDRKPK
jgi:hypothetical protein